MSRSEPQPESGLRAPTEGWFDEIADYLGTAYLRNAFTYGTKQEIDFLVGALELDAGMRVLDLGCGPGRHSLELARRGMHCVGIDHAASFIELARSSAAAEGLEVQFEVGDVRELSGYDGFDAVVCLCQGGFGLLGGTESKELLEGFARALRPGGRLALSAFHAYFAVRHLEAGDAFDPATGVNHEVATVRDPSGNERPFDLWTTCFTTRELDLLARTAGFAKHSVSGVRPGAYGNARPGFEHPELLLVAAR
jgi:SAM-dependent methyltransferase